MTAFQRISLPWGDTSVIPSLDFETFSTAGYWWQPPTDSHPLGRWRGVLGDKKEEKGLSAVGTRVYAEDPTTEVLCLYYDLKDGRGRRGWRPGLPLPIDLFAYLATGGPIAAWHAMFERSIWEYVCVQRYGWPPIDPGQWRCDMAKARAFGLPGGLGKAGEALDLPIQKDKAGTDLLNVFSIPRNPTKKDPRVRILPTEDERGPQLYGYCDWDVAAEDAASAAIPDLNANELAYWQADQEINWRGVGVDYAAVEDCIAIVDQVLERYARRLKEITNGIGPTQGEALKGWLAAMGVKVGSLDKEHRAALLQRTDLPPLARQAVEIYALCASASVKKVYSMRSHANRWHRLCNLFIYHGARTGRDTHADVQPGNLPKAGPVLRWCENAACGRPYVHSRSTCPWCNTDAAFSRDTAPDGETKGWSWQAVDFVLQVFQLRSLDAVEYFFGDALLAVSGVVRGLFVANGAARPGYVKRLVASDYSSIEAVVAACISGEQWRIDAFRRREDIYLHGAAAITGRTFEWYMANGGKKHPDRQDIGKPSELGLGFGGWINAYRNFGGEGTDKEIRDKIIAWQARSPAIVEMWGGQYRGKPWALERYEMYGLEGMAVSAVLWPGQRFQYRDAAYEMLGDVLYCILPSGRRIAYQQPRLTWGPPHKNPDWAPSYRLTFWGWNTNPNMGATGWVLMETYGGKLFENVVQAVARDIMAHAVVQLERLGWPVVLRVHDELVSEIEVVENLPPEGERAIIAEYERIMADVPEWAKGWPIRAGGGWLGLRYRKD